MAAVTITVRKDASYKVEGDVLLVDHEGNVIPIPTTKPFFSLCRCGASTNKPFCDGTHTKIGFRAAEAAQRAFDAATAASETKTPDTAVGDAKA